MSELRPGLQLVFVAIRLKHGSVFFCIDSAVPVGVDFCEYLFNAGGPGSCVLGFIKYRKSKHHFTHIQQFWSAAVSLGNRAMHPESV
ncbi:MAG: hypothetical protein JAY74_20945 [Candidatus Thiodiazotropha taylori]|nr:hypothetical protein [Candidatus Thiodiazotropha taylori]